MTYDFKCNKCGKKFQAIMRLDDYEKEREKIKCCGVKMERDFKPTAIFTTSSPNRY